MGVWSDGSYGVAKDLIYSFPVTCRDGKHTIVQGLEIDPFSRGNMQATEKELQEEKEEASSFLH